MKTVFDKLINHGGGMGRIPYGCLQEAERIAEYSAKIRQEPNYMHFKSRCEMIRGFHEINEAGYWEED